MFSVHFSFKKSQLLVLVFEIYLKILVILPYYAINFILADELFAKVLRSLETRVLVNNNLCGKLVSPFESPTTFDERFKVTFVPVFTSIPGITDIPEIEEPVFLILIN